MTAGEGAPPSATPSPCKISAPGDDAAAAEGFECTLALRGLNGLSTILLDFCLFWSNNPTVNSTASRVRRTNPAPRVLRTHFGSTPLTTAGLFRMGLLEKPLASKARIQPNPALVVVDDAKEEAEAEEPTPRTVESPRRCLNILNGFAELCRLASQKRAEPAREDKAGKIKAPRTREVSRPRPTRRRMDSVAGGATGGA